MFGVVVGPLALAASAIVVPLLPVTQTTTSISWPEGGTLDPVTAPLVAYYPLDIEVELPCSAVTELREQGREGVVHRVGPCVAGHPVPMETTQLTGICVLANFSEQFLISDAERETLTRLSLEHVAGRVPVLIEIKDQSGDLGPDMGELPLAVAALAAGYAPVVVLAGVGRLSPRTLATLTPGRNGKPGRSGTPRSTSWRAA